MAVSVPRKSPIAEWRSHMRDLFMLEARDVWAPGTTWIWGRDEPVQMHLTFYLPRPSDHWGRNEAGIVPRYQGVQHTRKPDIENLAKAVMDEAEGTLVERDQQVARLLSEKLYVPETNDRCGCWVVVEPFAERTDTWKPPSL